MYCHCGTKNIAPRWTFTDPCKPEVRQGAREESVKSVRITKDKISLFISLTVLIWCHKCCEIEDKKEEIWPSPMTKAPTSTEMSTGQSDNVHYFTYSCQRISGWFSNAPFKGGGAVDTKTGHHNYIGLQPLCNRNSLLSVCVVTSLFFIFSIGIGAVVIGLRQITFSNFKTSFFLLRV